MCYKVLISTLLLCAVTVQAVDQHQVEAGIARLQSNPSVSLYRERETGRIRFVSGQLSQAVASGEEIDATFAFLETHKTAFMMTNPIDELELKRVDIDDLGLKHVRLDQHYRGLRVYGSNMIAHFTSDGVLKAINGTFVEDIDLDVTPSIAADEAVRVSLADIDPYFGSAESRESKLLVFPWEDQNYLAWRIEVFSAAPIGHWEYFVDAGSGEIIYNASLIRHEAAIGTGVGALGEPRNHLDTDFDGVEYRMIDATRQLGNDLHGHGGQMPPGNVIQTSTGNWPNPDPPDPPATDADNVWDDPSQAATVDGHLWASLMYDWMLRVFGRNSYDDAGASMWTTVDYEYLYPNNASWISFPNGGVVVTLTAGDGWNTLAACPDVIAHEWGHAVTECGSNLIYNNESGALNESFSDMIGTAFELAHDTLDTPDWIMAENAVPWGGLRDVSNPLAYEQPDYYFGLYYHYWPDCIPMSDNDYCFVHRNSGVGNKWFYLLSMGGTHYDVTVTGIGVENAIRVAYRANMFYWTERSIWADGALGTQLAADDLDPSGYWRTQVESAWEAVGVEPSVLGEAPPSLAIAYPQGRPSVLTFDQPTTFNISIAGINGGSMIPGSANLNYQIDGGEVVTTPLTVLSPGVFEATLPALDCSQYIEYMIDAQETTEGIYEDPGTGNWWRSAPGTHPVVLYENDFEDKSRDADWERTGGWWCNVAHPTPAPPELFEAFRGGPDPDHAHSGERHWAHDRGSPYIPGPLMHTPETVTSPPIDCSGFNTVNLNFWRWLNVEDPEYDKASIEVSTDGQEFVTVWQNPTEITDYEWTEINLDISHVAADQSTVYVRFVMGPIDWAYFYAGWNFDDFRITTYNCDATADADADQIPDYLDNCDFAHNPGQEDADGDDFGDACDVCSGHDDGLDSDEDSVPNGCDLCEGHDDAMDNDHDGIPNGCDLCWGPDWVDADGDTIPDPCDKCEGFDDRIDSDDDGVPDGCDACEGYHDGIDTDNDGVPNACDICWGDDNADADGDSVPDNCDNCEGFDDALDGDLDLVPDNCDNCEFVANPDQADADGDGIGDACCCEGRVGDANGLGGDEPTVGDVSVMIDAKFITGICDGTISCLTEADINQSGGVGPTCDDITIGDISTLIDYLFITGSELGLADCP